MSRGYFRYQCICVFTAFVLLMQSTMFTEAASIQYHRNLAVIVDGEENGYIPALDASYEHNCYLSVTGLAAALAGTQKAFTADISKQGILLSTAIDEEHSATEAYLWEEEELIGEHNGNVSMNPLFLDEEERKYYSIILPHEDGFDAFMAPISLAMLLNLHMDVYEDRIEILTSDSFYVSAEQMEDSGYLQGVNALLIGDATTGEIFYQYHTEDCFPIASTTKLMTYLVFMDAVSAGRCSLDGVAVISEAAERLSAGPDGTIPMEAGRTVPVKELLYGMLLPSSNECALAVAEYTAGSEQAFVELMNQKAAQLNMTNAVFYNCHGLPCYSEQLIPAKVQNYMTAEEMFLLVSTIMNTYPQITEYTSTRQYRMESFDRNVKNTNALLYNMENMTGLKTGTTNKAGACLVTCITAEKDGEFHNLITVLFGAEGNEGRYLISELSCRYAMEVLEAGSTELLSILRDEDCGIPDDPERVVRKLLLLRQAGY